MNVINILSNYKQYYAQSEYDITLLLIRHIETVETQKAHSYVRIAWIHLLKTLDRDYQQLVKTNMIRKSYDIAHLKQVLEPRVLEMKHVAKNFKGLVQFTPSMYVLAADDEMRKQMKSCTDAGEAIDILRTLCIASCATVRYHYVSKTFAKEDMLLLDGKLIQEEVKQLAQRWFSQWTTNVEKEQSCQTLLHWSKVMKSALKNLHVREKKTLLSTWKLYPVAFQKKIRHYNIFFPHHETMLNEICNYYFVRFDRIYGNKILILIQNAISVARSDGLLLLTDSSMSPQSQTIEQKEKEDQITLELLEKNKHLAKVKQLNRQNQQSSFSKRRKSRRKNISSPPASSFINNNSANSTVKTVVLFQPREFLQSNVNFNNNHDNSLIQVKQKRPKHQNLVLSLDSFNIIFC